MYTLTVNVEQLQVLAAGLNELPRKVSQPVFELLQAQVKEQDDAREKAAREKAAAAGAVGAGGVASADGAAG